MHLVRHLQYLSLALLVILSTCGEIFIAAELPSLVQLKVDSRATAGIGHNMTFHIQFISASKETIQGASVTFYGADYFITQVFQLPPLEPQTDQPPLSRNYTLHPKSNNLKYYNIPEAITVVVEAADGSQLGSTVVKFTFSEFIGNLREHKSGRPDGRHRILLVGNQGAGKSSFINSVYALVTNNPSSQAALAGFGSISTTTVVRQFDPPGLPITLVDTWGLNDTNVDDYPIDLLLRGNYEYLAMDANRTVSPAVQIHRPDAVLFFVDAETTDTSIASAVMPAWARIARQVQLHDGMKLMIVITKIDNQNPNLRRDPNLSLKKEGEAVTKLLTDRGVIPNMITYTLLYHKQEDEEPNWAIDRSVYALLDHVLSAITGGNPKPDPPPLAQCVQLWRKLPQVTWDLVRVRELPASVAQISNFYALCALAFLYAVAAIFTYGIAIANAIFSSLSRSANRAAQQAAAPADPHGRLPPRPPAPKPLTLRGRLVLALPIFVLFAFLAGYASDGFLHQLCARTMF